MLRSALLMLSAAAVLTLGAGIAQAAPRVFKRNPELVTPAGLRDRVDFWKSIFATYDTNQVLIHHRAFPQVVFEVMDLRQEASEMGEVAFERYRKKSIEARTKLYYESMKGLAAGKPPANEFQQRIAEKIVYIKRVPKVYEWTVKEEMVRSQSGIRPKWVEALTRAGRYLDIMERIFVEQYGLPIELTRLPFVESSFDYSAYSSVGAAGIWQFMPRTGRQFRMAVNSVVDERRDPIKATDAAARYLSSAYSTLRTWPLAITSYNHGVGGVMKRVREAGTTDIVALLEHPTERPFGFASSNFFPSFLAALETYDDRRSLFPEVSPATPLRLTEYRLPRAMSVAHVTKQLGLPVEKLKEANYALLDRVWQGRSLIPSGYVLRVPEEYGVRLASLRAPEARVGQVAPPASSVYGGIVYKVRRGDTLSSIGRHFGVSVSQLVELNDLDGSALRVGQMLQVKARAGEREEPSSSQTADGAGRRAPAPASLKPNSSAASSYRVKRGDTLGKIAKRYGVTVSVLRSANGLRSDQVKIGQTLRIPR